MGRVVNRMCALGRALRSRRGSEVFRVFFFLPFILIYCVLVYWEVLVFVFLFLSFIFSCWGGGVLGTLGSATSTWQPCVARRLQYEHLGIKILVNSMGFKSPTLARSTWAR